MPIVVRVRQTIPNPVSCPKFWRITLLRQQLSPVYHKHIPNPAQHVSWSYPRTREYLSRRCVNSQLVCPFISGTQRRFPSKYISFKTLFRLFRVLLDLQKCILSGAYETGTCSFILEELQYYFLQNFRCNLTYYEIENFSDSSFHHTFKSENSRFLFCTKNSLTWAVN